MNSINQGDTPLSFHLIKCIGGETSDWEKIIPREEIKIPKNSPLKCLSIKSLKGLNEELKTELSNEKNIAIQVKLRNKIRVITYLIAEKVSANRKITPIENKGDNMKKIHIFPTKEYYRVPVYQTLEKEDGTKFRCRKIVEIDDYEVQLRNVKGHKDGGLIGRDLMVLHNCERLVFPVKVSYLGKTISGNIPSKYTYKSIGEALENVRKDGAMVLLPEGNFEDKLVPINSLERRVFDIRGETNNDLANEYIKKFRNSQSKLGFEPVKIWDEGDHAHYVYQGVLTHNRLDYSANHVILIGIPKAVETVREKFNRKNCVENGFYNFEGGACGLNYLSDDEEKVVKKRRESPKKRDNSEIQELIEIAQNSDGRFKGLNLEFEIRKEVSYLKSKTSNELFFILQALEDEVGVVISGRKIGERNGQPIYEKRKPTTEERKNQALINVVKGFKSSAEIKEAEVRTLTDDVKDIVTQEADPSRGFEANKKSKNLYHQQLGVLSRNKNPMDCESVPSPSLKEIRILRKENQREIREANELDNLLRVPKEVKDVKGGKCNILDIEATKELGGARTGGLFHFPTTEKVGPREMEAPKVPEKKVHVAYPLYVQDALHMDSKTIHKKDKMELFESVREIGGYLPNQVFQSATEYLYRLATDDPDGGYWSVNAVDKVPTSKPHLKGGMSKVTRETLILNKFRTFKNFEAITNVIGFGTWHFKISIQELYQMFKEEISSGWKSYIYQLTKNQNGKEEVLKLTHYPKEVSEARTAFKDLLQQRPCWRKDMRLWRTISGFPSYGPKKSSRTFEIGNHDWMKASDEVRHQTVSKYRILEEVSKDVYKIQIEGVPVPMYARGDLTLLNKESVSIAGTRKPSKETFRFVDTCVKEYIKGDYVVVSGMADGVDSKAHWTCINNGGKTIAVLPFGLQRLRYSKTTRVISDKIVETGGLLLSQYEPNFPGRLHGREGSTYFERNRILVGLSDTLIVCEAGNGTNNSYKHAKELNKKVIVQDVDNDYNRKYIEDGERVYTLSP